MERNYSNSNAINNSFQHKAKYEGVKRKKTKAISCLYYAMVIALQRNIILIAMLLLHSFFTMAQSPSTRNNQVRSLNAMVNYMDESSRIQQQIYFDIISFCEAHTLNTEKPRPGAWHVSVQAGSRLKSDFGSLKEVKPDAEGFIDDYQSRMLSFYRTRQDVNERLVKYAVKNEMVNKAFNIFRNSFDSMELQYKKLVNYVHAATFRTDEGFVKAKQIIDDLQPWFDKYNDAADQLYNAIRNYYGNSLKPLSSQKIIRTAQEELLLSVQLVTEWATQLYQGDDSKRAANDSALRALHKQALPKDELYLSKTYGYKYLNNGAFAHSRYLMFYNNMPSTIFWFKKDTALQYKNIPPGFERYNKFVNRYNWVIHYYNEFIECADGRTSAANMDYSPAMAAQVGSDTAQNVLLKMPRIGYRFAWLPLQVKQPTVEWVTNDTTSDRRRNIIGSAEPHHIVYLLDVSNSMKEEHKLDTLKQGMKYLVNLQRAVDNISVVAFADSSEKLIQFKPCNEKEFIYTVIDKLQTSGATNAEAAVRDGYVLVDSTLNYKGKTKVVIITDGQFTLEKPTKKKIELYKTKGVHLSILLLGRIHDIDTIEYFKALCEKGSGNFYDMRQYNLQEVLVKEASE